MSEYQYYEFQAVDRRLTDTEIRELRTYSSRAEITATSFTNEYHFGNFKGNAHRWMEKYFDAFLYNSNWSEFEKVAAGQPEARPTFVERARDRWAKQTT